MVVATSSNANKNSCDFFEDGRDGKQDIVKAKGYPVISDQDKDWTSKR